MRDGPGQALPPAPFAARLAAFALDLAVGSGCAALSAVSSLLWLLWQSGAGERQPTDTAIYAAIVLGTAWLPAWGVYTVFCWSRNGRTPGLAAMSLRLAGRDGRTPATGRCLGRLFALALFTVAALLSPVAAIGALAAAAQHTLPLVVGVAMLVPLTLAGSELAACLFSTNRQAIHDLLTGTRVVCDRPRPGHAALNVG